MNTTDKLISDITVCWEEQILDTIGYSQLEMITFDLGPQTFVFRINGCLLWCFHLLLASSPFSNRLSLSHVYRTYCHSFPREQSEGLLKYGALGNCSLQFQKEWFWWWDFKHCFIGGWWGGVGQGMESQSHNHFHKSHSSHNTSSRNFPFISTGQRDYFNPARLGILKFWHGKFFYRPWLVPENDINRWLSTGS